MKYLFDQEHEHEYIYVRSETVPSGSPLRLLTKDSYACVDCGVGMDIYNLDKPVMLGGRS